MTESDASDLSCDIAVQCLMLVGSKSFSHFLNVLERYINLLRHLSSSPPKRVLLLRAVSRFFAAQSQFNFIVVDKLLQYRVIDPIDIVDWAFGTTSEAGNEKRWSNLGVWDILRNTMDKVNNRVVTVTGIVEGVRAKEAAAGTDGDTGT